MKRVFVLLCSCLFLVNPLMTSPAVPTTYADDEYEVTPEMIAEFEAMVEAEMEFYNIPGVAVSIVQNDEVLYEQGFGIRNLETGDPFTTETLFRTASIGKSMTSMLVAQLIDEGLFDWDTPVLELYPDFQTPDPELTAQITVRDLMSMNTGLEESIFAPYVVGSWTVSELFAAIADQNIGGKYGEHFAYNNEVYATAGYIATAQAGYEPTIANNIQLIDERIFAPIGMENAIITDDVTRLDDNYSRSYEYHLFDDPHIPYEVALSSIGAVAPTGGAWINIEDMSRYAITQLNGGVTPDGTRIVSEENLAKTWESQVEMPNIIADINDTSYGIGWINSHYHDIPLRIDLGSLDGYQSLMVIFPEANVGVVILTNHLTGFLSNSELAFAFAELLYDREPEIVASRHSIFTQYLDIPAYHSMPSPEVDPAEVADVLGAYDNGIWVELHEDNTVWLNIQGSLLLLRLIPNDGYRIVSSYWRGTSVKFNLSGSNIWFYFNSGQVMNFDRLE